MTYSPEMAPAKPRQINVAEAKRTFSELVARVAFAGEAVTITRRGKPMAKLVPLGEPAAHLADVRGWLADDHPFFSELDASIAVRRSRVPRALQAVRRARRAPR